MNRLFSHFYLIVGLILLQSCLDLDIEAQSDTRYLADVDYDSVLVNYDESKSDASFAFIRLTPDFYITDFSAPRRESERVDTFYFLMHEELDIQFYFEDSLGDQYSANHLIYKGDGKLKSSLRSIDHYGGLWELGLVFQFLNSGRDGDFNIDVYLDRQHLVPDSAYTLAVEILKSDSSIATGVLENLQVKTE